MENNVTILNEMLADMGITIGEGTKYVINEGEQKQYHFRKENSSVAATFFASVIDGMNREELGLFVKKILMPAFEFEAGACGDFSNTEVNPSDTLSEYLKNGEIMPAVVNTEANLDFVNRYVHRNVMDITLYYRLIVKNNDEGLSSIVIDEHMLEIAGITEEEIFDRAKKYVQKHMVSKDLADLLAGTAYERDVRAEDIRHDMIVASYDRPLYGAGILAMAALDEDILSSYREQYPVYILPSCVNELIFVKDREERGDEYEFMFEQIEDVNLYQVEIEELLSNSLYVLQPSGKVELVREGKPLESTISDKRFFDFVRSMMKQDEEEAV